uniref:Immunity related GTPase cinema n=1 Tax=Oryctolagus cuniculus TaxID=9986 RepID=A0A5F9CFW8_RABIT
MAASKLPAVAGEEETTILMAKEELEALRTAFESGDIPQAASRLRELLASSESTRLEVGVTGESGAGKSSLINTLRGLGAEDPGAALTGVVETTMQPSPYPHPQFPDVTLWDLPGAGSPGCPADKYLKQVDFGRYDFFLLVSPRRCGAVETRLAAEILRQGKKFYFVRTKVDEDLAATRTQRPSGFSEVAVLQEIREHCAERLRASGISDPRIFLVSNLSPTRYDFPMLVSTWEHDLPAHRRHAGLLSLPDISLEALQKKKDMLQEQVLKTALVSGDYVGHTAGGGVSEGGQPCVRVAECRWWLWVTGCMWAPRRARVLSRAEHRTCAWLWRQEVAKAILMPSCLSQSKLPPVESRVTSGLKIKGPPGWGGGTGAVRGLEWTWIGAGGLHLGAGKWVQVGAQSAP